nr:MAG TPA: hypothetical protein [Caudoviricetes sp.]
MYFVKGIQTFLSEAQMGRPLRDPTHVIWTQA